MTTPDWTAARGQMMLDPTVTMLNTGSFGPTPVPVFEAANEFRKLLAMGPTNFFVRTLPPLLWDARTKTANFLGTAPERFVFTSNVSAAINLVVSGLRIDGPGEVLMTDHEYGSMVWCWERAAARQNLDVKTFPLPTMPRDPGVIVEAAVRAMTPRTKVFFFSHALSPTGMVLPAKELCAEARRRGILTVVDGAHVPAMVALNIDDVGADYYAGNCHKWLLAPSGSGFVAVRDWDRHVEPLHVSWGYKTDADPVPASGPDARDAYGSTPRTRYLEFEGTKDVCPWLATPAAIAFQEALGWDAVRDRHAELAAYSRRVYDKLGLKLATPADRRMSGSMTACELPPGVNVPALRAKLWEHRIEIPVNERPDRMLLRISHHFYTTEAEIDRLADVLPRALREVT
ncbi:aminotransferase class V-fold PLP-dependent enzyme [Limnoglobus roseus]|uniref:Aminotransferase class V-fold PLP-dependent enzyme n=1 Tax=Limnoglobus roseus TaxID=2598579 RepID=A0A5C1A5Y9_9BACT|nr:aminotransferase class V-fold PLP-dependent enzyme [Limnoglobus roseus]QEL14531.1 aminotransferase class V-fold PLP-dependent enzyme [Limnoglobus roseus]